MKKDKSNIIHLSNKHTLFYNQLTNVRNNILSTIEEEEKQLLFFQRQLINLANNLVYNYKINSLEAAIIEKIITYDTLYALEVLMQLFQVNVSDNIYDIFNSLKSNRTLKKYILSSKSN